MGTIGSAEPGRLRSCVAAFGTRGFAVVDGGLFPDLPRLLKADRLFARSLFLDTADWKMQAAGPWLVGLGQAPDALDRVLARVGDRPAVMFWRCGAGEAVLFRHLRRLNMARIPRWAARSETAPAGDRPDDDEAVIFRHWDPRVLAALLPVLDAGRFSRILGDADEIAFETSDSGFKRVIKDATWPAARAGPLRLGTTEMLALAERRIATSRRRIADYLRAVAPRETQSLDDATLHKMVGHCEGSGKRFGLRSEQDLGRWAYVMAKRNWQAEAQPDIVDFMREGRASPRQRIVSLVDRIAGEEARASSGGSLG